jgi:hypothetical protein
MTFQNIQFLPYFTISLSVGLFLVSSSACPFQKACSRTSQIPTREFLQNIFLSLPKFTPNKKPKPTVTFLSRKFCPNHDNERRGDSNSESTFDRAGKADKTKRVVFPINAAKRHYSMSMCIQAMNTPWIQNR